MTKEVSTQIEFIKNSSWKAERDTCESTDVLHTFIVLLFVHISHSELQTDITPTVVFHDFSRPFMSICHDFNRVVTGY